MRSLGLILMLTISRSYSSSISWIIKNSRASIKRKSAMTVHKVIKRKNQCLKDKAQNWGKVKLSERDSHRLWLNRMKTGKIQAKNKHPVADSLITQHPRTFPNKNSTRAAKLSQLSCKGLSQD